MPYATLTRLVAPFAALAGVNSPPHLCILEIKPLQTTETTKPHRRPSISPLPQRAMGKVTVVEAEDSSEVTDSSDETDEAEDPASASRHYQRWTKEEEATLRRLKLDGEEDWTVIAEAVGGARTAEATHAKWKRDSKKWRRDGLLTTPSSSRSPSPILVAASHPSKKPSQPRPSFELVICIPSKKRLALDGRKDGKTKETKRVKFE
ncbi:hypothetical protein JCM10213_002300 [Rhodosporidiobolus nylandii]